MKPYILTLIGGVVLTGMAVSADRSVPLYLDDSAPLEERVEDALSRMTMAEKVGIIHAQSKFSSPGVQRLGIPGLWTTDGPHGIRPDVLWDEWEQAGATNDSCVAFPALTCLAATWNPDMARLYGRSIGEEARYRNKNVLLGPGVNINRTPLNGRNFEYMGEDPLLASMIVVPYVEGVQENGVAACVKHYALNNQEADRDHVDVRVDDRTLHEIYLPAFRAAVVDGGAWSIMPGYNKYDGEHACENNVLLLDILKGDWGFDGVAISDWGAVHNTEKVASNGLDMEFGSWTNGLNWGASNAYDDYYLAKPYLKLLEEGKLPVEQLDDKARRVLRLIMRTEMNRNRPYGSLNSDEHYAAARRIGGEGIVLLKNEKDLLPLLPENVKKVLVVGENAIKMMTVGGGSSSLKVQHETLPLEGIRKLAADKGIEVVYERGYVGDVTGEYNGVTTGQDLNDSRTPEQLIADAVKAAKDADAVIFIGGLNKSDHQDAEGVDRLQYSLPYGQDAVIEALAKANPNLAVVGLTGNAYAMPWLDKVPAVVQGWYIGSEAGNALADVLFGDVNPSGKLPITFAVDLKDYAAHTAGDPEMYPGTDGIVRYKEGLDVGYRHTDKLKDSRVNFPFGHGLSYTDFSLGQPTLTGSVADGGVYTLTVPVSNTGAREGAEVVQVYVRDKKASVARPEKELKGFRKVTVAPGETVDAVVTLGKEAFAFYDPATKMWTVEPGDFELLVGTSGRDISARVPVKVSAPITWSDAVTR
ncbi:MAG: glycoside hydrolase family 3 C-terminal domain-containing protein [Muribaculaceae bacterium]|nr:glycoside hydrolase family 3 C-terminal domain-containing protein [Muribaculaceae bacterium]